MRDDLHLIQIPAGGEAVIRANPLRPETILLVENPKRPMLLTHLLQRATNPLRRLRRLLRRPNIAGYKDEEGVFHPIRWDPEYDYRRAGEPKRYATNRSLPAEEVRFYMRRTGRRATRRTARRTTRRTARRTTRRTARRTTRRQRR